MRSQRDGLTGDADVYMTVFFNRRPRNTRPQKNTPVNNESA
jgi:hypothetical protein